MSLENVHYLNVFLGSGAILLQVFSVAAFFALFFGSKKNIFLDFISKHFLSIGFLISLLASVFPLVYSEIINFPPCSLCWWQRIFMFPLVLMFAVALWDKPARQFAGGDKIIIRYALPLICAGFLISVYQNFFYYFGENSNLPCDASGVSCYQRLVYEFGGYISLPMLALTAFSALLVLFLVAHFYRREN